nr:hypothetical protein [Mucilaginibacter sp. X5P1]
MSGFGISISELIRTNITKRHCEERSNPRLAEPLCIVWDCHSAIQRIAMTVWTKRKDYNV